MFDCKFSSDGLKFACTDSHGHLCIFGYGSSDRYSRVSTLVLFISTCTYKNLPSTSVWFTCGLTPLTNTGYYFFYSFENSL